MVGAMATHKELWEYGTEVRYEPLGRFLDLRGSIADALRIGAGLAFWSITENRIDFRVTEESHRETAFVSYRNLGYAVINPDSPTYFSDRAAKFFRELLKVPGYVLTPIQRFGFRIRSVSPFSGEYDALRKKVIQVISPPNELTTLIKGSLIDVGFTYEFTRGDVGVKAVIGPLAEKEMRQHFRSEYFSDEDLFPKVGLFLDTDYFKANPGNLKEGDVADFLKTVSKERQELTQSVNRLLLG